MNRRLRLIEMVPFARYGRSRLSGRQIFPRRGRFEVRERRARRHAFDTHLNGKVHPAFSMQQLVFRKPTTSLTSQAFLGPLADAQAGSIAGMTRRATIDGRTPAAVVGALLANTQPPEKVASRTKQVRARHSHSRTVRHHRSINWPAPSRNNAGRRRSPVLHVRPARRARLSNDRSKDAADAQGSCPSRRASDGHRRRCA